MGFAAIAKIVGLSDSEFAALQDGNGRPSIATLRKILNAAKQLEKDLNKYLDTDADISGITFENHFAVAPYKVGKLLPQLDPRYNTQGWEVDRHAWENSADVQERKDYENLDALFHIIMGLEPGTNKAKCKIKWHVDFSTDGKFRQRHTFDFTKKPWRVEVWMEFPP